tara:strand:- start:210 stop:737 length:528 start_codon:yes stop_codon:yes gene_type:complete
MNNQGKTQKQYKDSARFAWYGVIGMAILLILMTLLSGCYGPYYLTDAEYSDVRESHASVTYYDNQIYWGWGGGYYYYYGKPHWYPWYYYYNTCPPSHHNITTHVVVTKPVKRPTHRPNRPIYKPRPNNNKGNVTIKTNTNVKTNVNRNNNVKINVIRNKSNNSSKRSVKTRRNPK